MSVDQLEFRRVMGHFATGVTIVTTHDGAGKMVLRVVDASGTVHPYTVTFGTMAGTSERVAKFENTGGKNFKIEVSDRARDKHVERAIAHEVAELLIRLDAEINGKKLADKDALVAGGTATDLSAHDIGRIAELKVLLRQLSAEAEAAETILFRDGKLTEASASNVFIVKRGVIVSPPKSNLILPGITYDVIAELAQANNLPMEFRDVAEAEVRGADEIWVSSSSKEVFPIVALDGRPVGDGKPGPVFRRMYQLYQDFKQRVMRAGKREAISA